MTYRARFPVPMLLIGLLGTSLGYAGEHPTRVDENSDCRECHADKLEGDHVHPALKNGCTPCHAIENQGDTSYVTLKQSPSVCFACHQQEVFQFAHLPYSSGWCLRCHAPHASANPKLLRGKVNDVCLACHLSSPERGASRLEPTIVLTADRTMGHPYAHHPVNGKPDPLTHREMSCVSCHAPHGAAKKPLLKMGEQVPEDALNKVTETNDMCRKCHYAIWGLDHATLARKKNHKADKRSGQAIHPNQP